MKLFKRQRYAQDPHPPAVIASAALVDSRQIRTAVRTDAWQRENWDYYDSVSHLRRALNWIANSLSQCRLYVAEVDSDTGQSSETTNEAAKQPLDELLNSQPSSGYLLSRMGLQILIVGETFLVGFDHAQRPGRRASDPRRRWLVCSSEEITMGTGNRVQVRLPENDQQHTLDGDYAMLRIWRPHPRRAFQPDTPIKSMRGDLAELTDLSHMVRATARSRFARGLFVVPESSSFASPEESENINPLHADPYIDAMVRSWSAGIRDPSSPSVAIPVVTRSPDDATGKFQFFDLAADFSERISELRSEARRNVTSGLEMPKEILDGLGDTNHWSAARIIDEAITLCVRPLGSLIGDAITEMYHRPALEATGGLDPDKYRIELDTNPLNLRANRAPEAIGLFEQGLLKRDVVLREHGYAESDMPEDTEAQEILLRQLVASHPQLVYSLMPELVKAQPPAPSAGDNQPASEPASEPASRNQRPRPDMPNVHRMNLPRETATT